VRDVMADAPLAALVRRHLAAAAATLPPIEGIDTGAYAEALLRRFENPAIAHETFQIAMDGSEKMPQRVFAAIPDARRADLPVRAFAFATAAWLRHVSGRTHDCAPYDLRDPIADRLDALAAGQDAAGIVAGLRGTGILPPAVARDDGFWAEVTGILAPMLSQPMTDVIAREAARASGA